MKDITRYSEINLIEYLLKFAKKNNFEIVIPKYYELPIDSININFVKKKIFINKMEVE
jgi:hypothetical protein